MKITIIQAIHKLNANKYPPGWKQRRRNDKEKPSKPAT